MSIKDKIYFEASDWSLNNKIKTEWGFWEYTERGYLDYKNFYTIDLKTKNTNSKLLDLIFQINTKDNQNWDEHCVSDLIKALNDILYPQANCCSSGENKKFSAKELCEKYDERLKFEKLVKKRAAAIMKKKIDDKQGDR
jgi:hypothetical protein